MVNNFLNSVDKLTIQCDYKKKGDLYYDRNKTASNHGGKIHNEKAIIRYDTNSFSYK